MIFGHGRCLCNGLACSFDLGRRCGDMSLVRFVDLAVRAIELDAVAVRRNMRTGDHQTCRVALETIEGKGGRRDIAAVEYPEAERGECAGTISRNIGA